MCAEPDQEKQKELLDWLSLSPRLESSLEPHILHQSHQYTPKNVIYCFSCFLVIMKGNILKKIFFSRNVF